MGGPKAVFNGPQEAVADIPIPFEGEHRIDKMLQHLGPGQQALLGDVAHQHQGCVLSFGDPLQGSGAFAYLGHRTGGAGQLAIVQGLDAVDDGNGWPQGLQFLQHQLEVGFGQKAQGVPNGGPGLSQALPAQFHLLGRFFSADVQH